MVKSDPIDEKPEQDQTNDLVAPDDPAERKAWMEAIQRESRQNLLRAIREHDESMKELENEKGILERLFGYRTSV